VLDWAPNDRFSYATSLGLAYGLAGVVAVALLAVAVAKLLDRLSRARRDRALTANASATSALHAGPTVLTGVIEHAESAEGLPAVRVAITQSGRQWKSRNGTRHEWKETSRAVDVRPFSMRLDDGATVRVVADESVRLIDALDMTEIVDATTRRRIATLDAGERVTAIGALQWEAAAGAPARGYRSAGHELVVRARRGEPLLLSAKPLMGRHTHWARFYAWIVAMGVLALLGVHGLVFAPFHRLVFTGRSIEASASLCETYTTRNKNVTTMHYRVGAAFIDRHSKVHVLIDDISEAGCSLVQAGSRKVPFVAAPDLSIYQAGTHPGLSLPRGLAVGMGFLAALIAFYLVRRGHTPWYEQVKVIDRGSGPLFKSDA
jgi:hypothetical protein